MNMRIIFDIGGTVIGLADMSLRPGIKETIDVLRLSGNAVDFWTGGPIVEYSFLLSKFGVAGTVYSKNNRLPFVPDICVDDDPSERLPGKVVLVQPYFGTDMPHEEIKASALISAAQAVAC